MRHITTATALLFASSLLVCPGALAQDDPQQTPGASTPYQPAAHAQPDPEMPEGVTLEQMLDAGAAGPPDSWPQPVHDNPVLMFTLVEQLEYRAGGDGADQFAWDAQGWYGNDNDKFWWKSEGAAAVDGNDEGDAEFQALYARPLSAFWFAQVGVRYDNAWAPGNSNDRVSLVLGVQGLAPYRFEVEPTLFLTDDGDLLGRLTASYDVYLTQRLVLQPRTEIDLAAQDVPDYGLGMGFNNLSLEARLRYEIRREFAPYIGVRYNTLLGETAAIGRNDGAIIDDLQAVFGLRIAF